MQERFDALLAELGLAPRCTFTLGQLLDRITAARGRRIELVPVSVNDPDEPTGAWVPYPEVDVIFYNRATTPSHQAHFVLHEIGHVLCDHVAQPNALARFLTQFSPPGHDPQRLVEAFGLFRSSWSTEEERAAEAFARHVGPRLRDRSQATGRADLALGGAFTRVLDVLGGQT